jgi:hypothetical protein
MSSFRAYTITPVLPWEQNTDQDKLYRIILIVFILLAFLFSFLVANMPYTERSRAAKEKVPERLAKVLTRKKEVKPPPPPPKPKVQVKKEKPKPEPKKKREPKKKPKNEKEKKAREAAQKKLNEAKDILAELQDIKIDLNNKPLAKGGAKAKVADRKLITARATTGSGGIEVSSNVSADSSGFGGDGQGKALVAMATTQVESGIGTGGGGGGSRASGGDGKRTLEDIRKVFDAKKGILFSLYSRALRANPTLQGSILLHLVIAPDGSVTKCEVVSSEINDSDLVRKIAARVKTFNFGADDVDVWDDTYEVNLVPS